MGLSLRPSGAWWVRCGGCGKVFGGQQQAKDVNDWTRTHALTRSCVLVQALLVLQEVWHEARLAAVLAWCRYAELGSVLLREAVAERATLRLLHLLHLLVALVLEVGRYVHALLGEGGLRGWDVGGGRGLELLLGQRAGPQVAVNSARECTGWGVLLA